MMDGRLHVLTPAEIEALGQQLQDDVARAAPSSRLAEHLTPMLRRIGLRERRWQARPRAHQTPMIGIDRDAGVCLIHGFNQSLGQWVVETPQGRREWAEPPAGMRFFNVALSIREQLSSGALGMLIEVLGQHRQPFAFFLLGTLVINLLAIVTSLYSMQVYDRVIPSRGVETLIVLTVGVALSIVFELVLKFVRSLIMERFVQEVDTDLSHRIYERLMRVRIDQFPASVGTLAAQLRMYESVRAFAYSATSYVLVDTPFALLFLLMIWFIGGPMVAAVPAVFFVVSLGLGLAIKRRTENHTRSSQAAANRKLGLLVESVECAEAIKAQGTRWHFQSRWNALTAQHVSEDRRVRHITESSMFYAAALQQFSYVLMLATGAYIAATTNSLTSGGLIACSILSGRVLQPVTALPGMLSQWANAKYALIGIDSIFKLQTDHHETQSPLPLSHLEGHLEFEKVVFAYPGQIHGLQVPQWKVQPGERIGIIGGIGSGKSTLLKLMAGLYKPTDGRVQIDHLDIQQVSRAHLSEHIGYMQQSVQLFAGTLKDNLCAGLIGLTDEAVQQACQATGLATWVATHPKGLEMPISEGGQGVSGGQRQLIGMTRLLLSRPALWLLDEPTANMDDETERRLMQLLHGSVGPQQTLVLVTHKMALLGLVQRLVVMAQGRIVLDGPRDAVLEHLRKASQPQAPASAPAGPEGAAPTSA